jgi:hypothetical protein
LGCLPCFKLRWLGIVFCFTFAALVIAWAALFAARNKSPNVEAGLKKFNTLVIRDAYSKKVYGKWPLNEAGDFAVEFIHSVNKSPVREAYTIEDGLIRLKAVRFSSFGAGMQSELEDGMVLTRDGDAMLITGFSSVFSGLNYIVGTVSDHLLFINEETISLRGLCGRNAHISIQIE